MSLYQPIRLQSLIVLSVCVTCSSILVEVECGLSCDVLSLCVGVGDNFTVAWEEDQISSLAKEEKTEEVGDVIYCSDSCGVMQGLCHQSGGLGFNLTMLSEFICGSPV